MALTPVGGPAGGGKSGYIRSKLRPGQIVIDFTLLHQALSGAEPGDVRRVGDPLIAITKAVKDHAVAEAQKRELSGYVTTSSKEELVDLERQTGQRAIVVDPGYTKVVERLADADTGELSPECANAISRWFGIR